MPIGDLFPEFLAVALVSETCVATFGTMQPPIVSTVRAIFLAANLADNRLISRADLVSHMVLGLVPADLCPDDFDFFLGNPDGLMALWTDIHAQLDRLLGT